MSDIGMLSQIYLIVKTLPNSCLCADQDRQGEMASSREI